MTCQATELLSGLASELTVRLTRPSELPRIQAHLLRLSADDRSLRFSAGVVKDDTCMSRPLSASTRLGAARAGARA